MEQGWYTSSMTKRTPQKRDPEPQWEVVNPAYDAARERLQMLAWVLDAAVGIPGTRIRFGVDALLGLIPGIGDVIGALFSSYILSEAAALGVPRTMLIRMGFNVALESVVGIIPLIGDLFDIGWKANLRNVKLLNDWMAHPTKTAKASKFFVAALLVVMVVFVISVGIGVVWFLSWFVGLISNM
jgi:hypothetical protein